MGWADLSAPAQDALRLALALLPLALIALWLVPGHRPGPLVAALLRRHWGVSATFLALIAVCVAAGVALLATERGLRAASARATDPFDVVVAAPGSETTALMAAVFLRPADMPLLDGPTLAGVLDDPRAALAAPVGFGDSVEGYPVVGTVAALPRHLAGAGPDAIEGRLWEGPLEAVAGANTPFAIGAALEPAHGHGPAAEPDAHGLELSVVGRMAPTGTPWDDAVLIPLEGVWTLHSMGTGHAPGAERLGPPWDPRLMPGVPAVLVRAAGLGEAYAFRAAHQRDGATMAFLPGAELARLHAILGDVREALSLSALVSLALVATAVLCGLLIVARLFRRRLALLAALGAPRRFLLAVLWLHAAAHLVLGAALGLALGWLLAAPAARVASERVGLAIRATPGREEALTVALFVGLAAVAALLPALLAPHRDPARDLR